MAGTRLSAVVLARNEERDLPECLSSLSFADEILLIDDGSTDGTRQIAEARGARVIPHPLEDFAAQRNFALTQADGEWVLFLDADERVPELLAREIRETIRSTPLHGFEIPMNHHFLGRKMRFGGWSGWSYPRLFRRGRVRYEREVHEVARVDGEIGGLRNPIDHYTDRYYGERVEKSNRYTTLEAKRMIARGDRVRWYHLVLMPLRRWIITYVIRAGFLEGTVGFIWAIHVAFSTFVQYAKAWESRNE